MKVYILFDRHTDELWGAFSDLDKVAEYVVKDTVEDFVWYRVWLV